jgi:hypothetical protein
MTPARTLGLISGLLAGSMGLDQQLNSNWASYGPPVCRYERQRYQGAANRKQCARRRAKKKQARASRKRNRK